ncbi:hypothetical protein [Streptomyces sp. NBC_01198]|uniref:hypothetical protein n=1 Tax=Streptomyces sp. NBC_01198 TaxID=2903769 RepID=UPI002E14EF9B|nr:hypothetical protein OG702_34990 [Streptomyces sp. NBC_01198]
MRAAVDSGPVTFVGPEAAQARDRAGGELVVFVIEPCLAKAHGPSFQYCRDGRLIKAFSFETPYYRGGEEPDLLRPALTVANLIGPQADLDRDDNEGRIVEATTGFFSLPELEMP